MFNVGRTGVGSSPDSSRDCSRGWTPRSSTGRSISPVRSKAWTAAARFRGASLGKQWELAQANLPADWSDLYAEVELDSSDYLERGALLLAPVNPARVKEELAYRFRVARVFGYGASAAMTERCLLRLDAEGISGHFQVLRSLSDSKPVCDAGPGLVRRRSSRLMADPVSWYLIEQGWEVVGSDGEADRQGRGDGRRLDA